MERLSACKAGAPGEVYNPTAPIVHTKSPIVQGTSVLAVKFDVSLRPDHLGDAPPCRSPFMALLDLGFGGGQGGGEGGGDG